MGGRSSADAVLWKAAGFWGLVVLALEVAGVGLLAISCGAARALLTTDEKWAVRR